MCELQECRREWETGARGLIDGWAWLSEGCEIVSCVQEGVCVCVVCLSPPPLPPPPLDESCVVSHNSAGILGVANSGRNTSDSQFYVTLQPVLWMDRKYVALG